MDYVGTSALIPVCDGHNRWNSPLQEFTKIISQMTGGKGQRSPRGIGRETPTSPQTPMAKVTLYPNPDPSSDALPKPPSFK